MLKGFTKTAFADELNHKKQLIVIGTGRRLMKADQYLSECLTSELQIYLVDNDEAKQGKKCQFAGRTLPVENWERVQNASPQDALLLITCLRYQDLLDQIEGNDHTKQLDVVCLAHLQGLDYEEFAMSKELPADMVRSSIQLIPKKLHYCWVGGKPLPDKNKYLIDGWHKMCPDYEIIQWDESNYDFEKIPYMKQAFERKVWGFVPDYARLDIVYEYGGIYLDTDVELLRSFDDLLYQDGFAGFEYADSVNMGQGFGAKAHHPMIKILRDDYLDRSFLNEDGTEDLTASPVIQTAALVKNGLITNGEYQVVRGLTIYPEKMFCAKNIHTMCIQIKDYTHSIHHFDGSWATEESRMMNQELSRRMGAFIKDNR